MYCVDSCVGLLLLLFCLRSRPADGISCYKCTGSTRISECSTIVTCNQDEICYQEKSPGIQGHLFNLGCRRKQDCQTTPVPINGRRFLLSNGTDPNTCTECCDSDTCNRGLCLVHGGWSEWSPWGTCSVSCGPGLQTRDRTCSNPYPDTNGDPCHGESTNYRVCPPKACADGGWSNWDTWSPCSASCGNGFKTRTRECSNPEPSVYGKTCRGQPSEISSCNNNRCPAITSSFSVDHPKALVDYHLTFSNVIYNLGGDFDPTTGIFTCSKPGSYMFTFILVKKRADTRVDFVACYLRKNSNDYFLRGRVNPTDDDTDKGNAYAGNTGIVHLDKGENVTLTSCSDPSSTMEYWSSFSGFLLYPDV